MNMLFTNCVNPHWLEDIKHAVRAFSPFLYVTNKCA